MKPNVTIVNAPSRACVGRPVTVTAQSDAGVDRISWWGADFPGSGSSYVFVPDARLEGKQIVINANDRDLAASCGVSSISITIMDKRLSYTDDGLRETDWCTANVSSPSIAAACGRAAVMANYVIGTPFPGLPFTANPSGSWIGRNFSKKCRTTEGSPADTARHLLWSCMLHKDVFARGYANDILNRHENGRADDSCESHEQDFNNNEIGKRMANAGVNCEKETLRLTNGMPPSVPGLGKPQINTPMSCEQ